MLVLSRQRDETIMIGDDIELTIVDIRGDKVRIGIKAPSRIAVHRKEVYEAIRQENEKAARLSECEITAMTSTLNARGKKSSDIPTAARLNAQQINSDRKESA